MESARRLLPLRQRTRTATTPSKRCSPNSVQKFNPNHDDLGRFASGPGGGGSHAGSEDLTRGGRDIVNGKTIYRNFGPNATGKRVTFDSFTTDRIKRNNQYVVEDPKGKLRRGTYIGPKSYSTGGRYAFQDSKGKMFEVEFDDAYRYKVYIPLNKSAADIIEIEDVAKVHF